MKTHGPWIYGRRGLHRANMPFAEMCTPVARIAKSMREGDLFRAERPSRRKGAIAIGMASGKKTAASGRAARMCRIEAVKPQARSRHLVERGRLDVRMAVITRFLPAMIVPHHQHDVGRLGEGDRGAYRQESYRKDEAMHGAHRFGYGVITDTDANIAAPGAKFPPRQTENDR